MHDVRHVAVRCDGWQIQFDFISLFLGWYQLMCAFASLFGVLRRTKASPGRGHISIHMQFLQGTSKILIPTHTKRPIAQDRLGQSLRLIVLNCGTRHRISSAQRVDELPEDRFGVDRGSMCYY